LPTLLLIISDLNQHLKSYVYLLGLSYLPLCLLLMAAVKKVTGPFDNKPTVKLWTSQRTGQSTRQNISCKICSK